jgi:hypothetical protein
MTWHQIMGHKGAYLKGLGAFDRKGSNRITTLLYMIFIVYWGSALTEIGHPPDRAANCHTSSC